MCVRMCVCVCFRICFRTITQKEIDLGTRNVNALQYMKIIGTSSIMGIVGQRSRSWCDFEIFLHLQQYKLLGLITQLCYELGS